MSVTKQRTHRRRAAAGLVAAALGVGLAGPALATPPPTPTLGQAIEGYAAYDGQDQCISGARPGVARFRDMLLDAYSRSRNLGISRACGQGSQSEHKEGRAFDWGVNVSSAAEKADAEELLAWLLATDSSGNKHARARRLGLMYIVWNHRIFKLYNASAGWQSYTGSNPHTDHVHFSFSWPGARGETSWWTDTPPPGYTELSAPAVVKQVDGETQIVRWSTTGKRFDRTTDWSSSGGYSLSRVGDRVISGDFNGNGISDIAVAKQVGTPGKFTLQVFEDGVESEGPQTWYTSTGTYDLADVGGRFVAGDWNNDGKTDVALVKQNGTDAQINRFVSTGSAFSAVTTWQSTGTYNLDLVGDRAVAGDVNGDGRDDIVLAKQETSGKFSFQVFADGYKSPSPWFTSSTSFDLSGVSGRLVAGDWNGDKKLDVALLKKNGTGGARMFRWVSTGSGFSSVGGWTAESGYNLDLVGDRIAAADVNRNGRDDIVVAKNDAQGKAVMQVFLDGVDGPLSWYTTTGGFNLEDVQGRLVLGEWSADGDD